MKFLNYNDFTKIMTRKPKIGNLTKTPSATRWLAAKHPVALVASRQTPGGVGV